MKLEVFTRKSITGKEDHLIREIGTQGAGLDKWQAALAIAIIDAGKVGDLRCFAMNQRLKPEAPVWPGFTVDDQETSGFVVRDNERVVAEVFLLGCSWSCVVDDAGTWSCDSPQEAVDTARRWLAKRWGLST